MCDQATGDQDRDNNVATARFQNPYPNVDRWVALGPRHIDGEGNIGAVGALFHLAINPQRRRRFTWAETAKASGKRSTADRTGSPSRIPCRRC